MFKFGNINYFVEISVTIRVYSDHIHKTKENVMSCSDPRRLDEERVRAALEQMDDEALAAMAAMMEEVAKKHPRPPRSALKMVENLPDSTL